MRKAFPILIAILALALAQPALAQEEEPQEPLGPVYIVQSGDTLYSIALRFGVTVDDILIVNNLDNANQLFVGDQIIIPGLPGVEGILETRQVAFGENLASLSRRFQIPFEQLAKLNRIVSPGQLYSGSALVIPVTAEDPVQNRRAVLSPGQTLLETAVLEGQNYWSILGHNEMEHAGQALPGQVLSLPGTQAAGPGGLPSAISEVNLSDFFQGETAIIELATEPGLAVGGQLGPYSLHFFPDGDRSQVALQGINALAEPDYFPLQIKGVLANGAQFSFSQMVAVEPLGYIFEQITVPPELIDPATTDAENEFVREYISGISDVKFWSGVFVPPSVLADCINSSFGNRRSYNGSAFTYYHGGVDFCGGTGAEIFAPAAGAVVFAGPLEVRGNYTLIDHGWGVYSGYMHQSEIFVQEGDQVETGQVIGLVGNTGRSTGAHLHWEIWVNGVLVNPLAWTEFEYP